MTASSTGVERVDADPDEVLHVARGIATAVAPESGLTDVQASLLRATTKAMTGIDVDYRELEPLGPDQLASVLATRDRPYRQRIVQHMVLGELVLTPLPREVADRVCVCADALRRGKVVAEHYGRDLFSVDFHELAHLPVAEVRERLHVPPKSDEVVMVGSPGPFDPDGMSEHQRAAGLRTADS